MRKLIIIGRSESGKSTLIQALRHEEIHYHKTQYIDYSESVIDTPGEYVEDRQFGGALAVYACEADIVGLLCSATEPFSLFPPNIVGMSTRPVVGIVTKCDHPDAVPVRASEWLKLAAVNVSFSPAAIKMRVFRKFLTTFLFPKNLKINKLLPKKVKTT